MFNLFNLFFLRKLTLGAMEPNVRDEITSLNRVPATNRCVSRALHLNLQKKKTLWLNLQYSKVNANALNLIFFNFAHSGLILYSAARILSLS